VKVEGGEILVCPSQVIMNNYRPSSSSYSSSPGGVVHYTCAKPPDILDFTRPSLPDIELEEEVAITIHGIEIVEDKPEEEADVELPDHIQAMVNKAMEDIQ